MQNPLVDVGVDEVRASLACDSLRHFAKAAWPILEPGVPLVWGWHHDVICEHLEAVTKGWISYLVMNVPPRYTKSTLTSVCWPAWEWIDEPTMSYLTISHDGKLATRDARKTRLLMLTAGRPAEEREDLTVIERIGYRGLLTFRGKDHVWEFADDQNIKSSYENDRRGKRVAVGIVAGGTGEGGRRILIDDPHKLEDWDSEPKRKTAIEFATGIAPGRRNTSAGDSALVLIMQRVHEEDCTAAVLGELDDIDGWGEDVVHLCLPEEYEPTHPLICPPIRYLAPVEEEDEDGEVTVIEPELKGDRRTEEGELLFPERFGEDDIAAHRRAGSLRWASNYRQYPSPAEGNVFLKKKWRYHGRGGDREELPFAWERVLNSWDLTFGSKKATASYVCGQIWGKDGARSYLLAEIYKRMTFTEMKAAVRALYEFTPLDQGGGRGPILVEQAADGAALVTELEQELPGIRGVPVPALSKVARAVAVQPYQEAEQLYIPRGIIPAPAGYEERTTKEFVHTLGLFPAGKGDEVDTLSQALQELYHSRTDEVASVSTGGSGKAPVTERHGIRKVGGRYVDKD